MQTPKPPITALFVIDAHRYESRELKAYGTSISDLICQHYMDTDESDSAGQLSSPYCIKGIMKRARTSREMWHHFLPLELRTHIADIALPGRSVRSFSYPFLYRKRLVL